MKKKMFLVPFILASTLSFFFATFPFGAAVLPDDEVEALREIAEALGKTDWNFSADPCSGSQYGWIKLNQPEGIVNNVTYLAAWAWQSWAGRHLCRILKGQNLPGTLPPDLAKLPYLQQIDLTRNYLNGSIPPGWESYCSSLLGNRLTGSIPKELGNITTLKNFTVEFNQLSGNLPPELGDMSSIERFRISDNFFSGKIPDYIQNWTKLEKLLLSLNYFTGELPDSFAGLITLKDFRISDNRFSGKIPNYIQNWKKLGKLVIQAGGLNWPIPLGVALLEKLSDLRISDLNGSEEPFPPLNNLTHLKTLILGSCNITGWLPEFLGGYDNVENLVSIVATFLSFFCLLIFQKFS
ncbi:hypothetical protein FH972_019532 [Carpinus fangiana]|uniref:Leucine-rich repeat-containing N-terminal plant-type domain-containing protein n=1 Tax=Carpinus fangiana TaxID=176857 RepID=A0A5N6RRX3_9ROSI|nr:hypothetical protein FH972_019532 [Carpinus fangiana]